MALAVLAVVKTTRLLATRSFRSLAARKAGRKRKRKLHRDWRGAGQYDRAATKATDEKNCKRVQQKQIVDPRRGEGAPRCPSAPLEAGEVAGVSRDKERRFNHKQFAVGGNVELNSFLAAEGSPYRAQLLHRRGAP